MSTASASADTVPVTVSGQEVRAKGVTVLSRVNRQVWTCRGCYHHKLSIAGNCRMCLVEVEKSQRWRRLPMP